MSIFTRKPGHEVESEERSALEMSAGISIQIETGSTPSRDVGVFLEREWDAWHRLMDDDPAVDWNGSSVQIVARDGNGAIAGAAVGRIRAGVGHLSELMVAEALRRQGLGTDLLKRFEEHCASAGCHKLTVHAELDGPAHLFYLRNGWRREAVFRRDRGGRDFVRLFRFTTD